MPLSSASSFQPAQVDSTNQTGVLQSAKQIKVAQPITVSYSIPGQQVATVLAIPQGQQQSYLSLRPDLVTMDCAQLYNTTGTITSPTGEIWTIPVYTTPSEQTGFTHIAIQQDAYDNQTASSESAMTAVSSVSIPSIGGPSVQEEVGQTVTNTLFPITVAGATGVCPSGTQTLHIWDPQASVPEPTPQVIGGRAQMHACMNE